MKLQFLISFFALLSQVESAKASDQAAAIEFAQKATIQALDYTQGNASSLTDAQDSFTPEGWAEFMKPLKEWVEPNGAPKSGSVFTPSEAPSVVRNENGVLHLKFPGVLTQTQNISSTKYRAVIKVSVNQKLMKIESLKSTTCGGASRVQSCK